jgi:polar amino acid transport system ATP-binding protein
MNDDAPIVRLDRVQKSFGAARVLDGVSFDVHRGQVVAIVGKSGSGKSTALRCIDRLEAIDGGQITVCGQSLDSPALDLRQLRREVGIVFQSYNLFPHLTVAQNVMLALRKVRRKSVDEATVLAQRVLHQVGMQDKAQAYPEQLSGGQQQRVAIARSLAMEPQLMLFDEVTSALDPELTGEVLQVMESLAKGGMTMILVTHEMAFAAKVAHQIVFMHAGRVHEAGGPEILTNPKTPELRRFVGNGL